MMENSPAAANLENYILFHKAIKVPRGPAPHPLGQSSDLESSLTSGGRGGRMPLL